MESPPVGQNLLVEATSREDKFAPGCLTSQVND